MSSVPTAHEADVKEVETNVNRKEIRTFFHVTWASVIDGEPWHELVTQADSESEAKRIARAHSHEESGRFDVAKVTWDMSGDDAIDVETLWAFEAGEAVVEL